MVGMEAAALSAAITGILKVVGNKLAPLVIKEYSSIVGVKKDLQELQDLVQEINCRLGTAGDRATGDAPWLKKLKQVAYDVDDVVDEFQLKAEKHDANGGGGFVSRYLQTKTESFIFQCKVAKKIKKINKRFAKIVKQRTDLTAIFGHDPVSHINMSVVNMQTLPVGDDTTVLGRDQEMHQIISNLVETNDKQEIKIVSIVGLGGSGKTALAKLIFNDGETIEKHFEVRLWVHVSQEFDYEKLIKKLFEAFADKDTGQPSLPYMSKRIQGGLTQKKFLIVMDDVWTESQNKWGEIMGYLKTGAPGSGLLLTTRSIKVAEAVRSTYQLCLPRLSQDDSWHLFQQSFRMPAKFLDSDFTLVAKEIIQACCGLPLAIKVLAGSLADKELIGEWQAMRDILLDVEGEAVSACLNLSYLNLPSHLKQCFTMCSLFPKGHLIYKQQLIDQWIAHDMISLSPGVDDLEHIGHMYFNSLVQLFFLQDVEEYEGVVRCKMHDLFHDLARSILCEEISTTVQEDATSYTKGYRYFSLIEQPRKLLPEEVFENARIIYVDKGDDIIFGKALKNTKHLRSIILNSISSTAVLTSIFQVKNLKYLEMSQLECEALPEAISDIWSMQALYIKSSSLLELPKSIGMLKKLRTLSLTGCSSLKRLPDSIGDCDMLSTLDFTDCIAFKELPNSIGRNKRLRALRLVWTMIGRLPSSITTLENLEYLKLERNVPIELPEGIGNLTKIKALELDKYIAIPSGIGQLTRLEKINSFCVEFDVKYARISELETLSRISGKLTIHFLGRLMDSSDARKACLKRKENLHELELSWGPRHRSLNEEHELAVLDGLEPPLGIKQLTIRTYGGGQFAWWMLKQVGGGVQGSCQFPFLTKMSLFDFPNLKHLDGLVQLPCLEKLHLKDMPALESISGGPFPSLVKLKMERLCSLGEVWMVPDMTFFGKEEGEGCNNYNPHQSGQVQIGSHLTYLDIYCCPKLRVKPYFPNSLEHLQLVTCNINMLLSPCQGQGSSSSYSSSPPSYSHLKVIELRRMKSSLPLSPPWPPGLGSAGCTSGMLQHMSALESLVIFCCNDLTELPECLGELCSLQKMTIKNCDSLCSLPKSIGRLTSLQELEIQECEALVQFPESLGELRSLRRLEIFYLSVLTCLPKSMCHLRSLKELSIGCCNVLSELPECLGELHCLRKFKIWGSDGLTHLPQSLCCLMSLQELEIGLCDAIGELPECLGELHCLGKFRIWELPSLTCLPQSLCRLTSSLEKFEIVSCPGIKSLPEWIKGLTALQQLEISGCPHLERRCNKEMGEDWHLISHIPILRIG